MGRWRPKDWSRPRSRRWRDDRSPDVPLTEIIKEKYCDGRRRPEWARIAHKFGWLTMGDYFAIEPTAEGRNVIAELVYGKSPLIGLMAKVRNFAGPEAAQVNPDS